MENLFDFSAIKFSVEKSWVAALLFFGFCLYKMDFVRIILNYSETRGKKHDLAMSLLGSKMLGVDANAFLREHLERSSFLCYYGIDACYEMRSAIFSFQAKSQGRISWRCLRLAYPSIRLNGSNLSVTLKFRDHVLRWVVTVFSFLVCVFSVILAFIAVDRSDGSWLSVFLATCVFVYFAVAMFLFSLNWPYHSAKKVIAEIEFRKSGAKEALN